MLRILHAFQGSRAPSKPGRRRPRSLAVIAGAVCLALALSGCGPEGSSPSGGSDTSTSAEAEPPSDAGSDQPPASTSGLHQIKLPSGKTILVASGITVAAAEGGLFTIAIAGGVPLPQAAFAIGQLNIQMANRGFQVLWRVGNNTVKLVRAGTALVGRAGATALRGARALKPASLPLLMLMLVAYERGQERSQLIEIGRIGFGGGDYTDDCLITFYPEGGETYSVRVASTHKACREDGQEGTELPAMYLRYGDPKSGKFVTDFIYPRRLKLVQFDTSDVTLKSKGAEIKGTKCTLKFDNPGGKDVKIKLEPNIIGGSGSKAKASNPCAVYAGQKGKVVDAGERVLDMKIFKADRVPKGYLLYDATLKGFIESKDGPAGTACLATIDPFPIRGMRLPGAKKVDGKYTFKIPTDSDAGALCRGPDYRRAWAHVSGRTLHVWMETDDPHSHSDSNANHYTVRRNWQTA